MGTGGHHGPPRGASWLSPLGRHGTHSLGVRRTGLRPFFLRLLRAGQREVSFLMARRFARRSTCHSAKAVFVTATGSGCRIRQRCKMKAQVASSLAPSSTFTPRAKLFTPASRTAQPPAVAAAS